MVKLNFFRVEPSIKPLHLKVEPPNVQTCSCELEDRVYLLTAETRSVLAKRKLPESRMSAYKFFTQIYSSIEQEMLNEQSPENTVCHDPYIEKLLEKLQVNKKWKTVTILFIVDVLDQGQSV